MIKYFITFLKSDNTVYAESDIQAIRIVDSKTSDTFVYRNFIDEQQTSDLTFDENGTTYTKIAVDPSTDAPDRFIITFPSDVKTTYTISIVVDSTEFTYMDNVSFIGDILVSEQADGVNLDSRYLVFYDETTGKTYYKELTADIVINDFITIKEDILELINSLSLKADKLSGSVHSNKIMVFDENGNIKDSLISINEVLVEGDPFLTANYISKGEYARNMRDFIPALIYGDYTVGNIAIIDETLYEDSEGEKRVGIISPSTVAISDLKLDSYLYSTNNIIDNSFFEIWEEGVPIGNNKITIDGTRYFSGEYILRFANYTTWGDATTYELGDTVIKSNSLYKCNQAECSGTVWTIGEWTTTLDTSVERGNTDTRGIDVTLKNNELFGLSWGKFVDGDFERFGKPAGYTSSEIVEYENNIYSCMTTCNGVVFNSNEWTDITAEADTFIPNEFEKQVNIIMRVKGDKNFIIRLNGISVASLVQSDIPEFIVIQTEDAYNQTLGYTAGDFVLYNSNIYCATEDITAPAGTWDISKWTLSTELTGNDTILRYEGTDFVDFYVKGQLACGNEDFAIYFENDPINTEPTINIEFIAVVEEYQKGYVRNIVDDLVINGMYTNQMIENFNANYLGGHTAEYFEDLITALDTRVGDLEALLGTETTPSEFTVIQRVEELESTLESIDVAEMQSDISANTSDINTLVANLVTQINELRTQHVLASITASDLLP